MMLQIGRNCCQGVKILFRVFLVFKRLPRQGRLIVAKAATTSGVGGVPKTPLTFLTDGQKKISDGISQLKI
jgi:hypothetical protein